MYALRKIMGVRRNSIRGRGSPVAGKSDSSKATKALQLISFGCSPDGGCRGDLIREVKGQEARGVELYETHNRGPVSSISEQ